MQRDVADFCPDDPGYARYVRVFTRLLSEPSPPLTSNFEISETIGLTRWGDAEKETDPIRFRRFRVFTNAIGIAITVLGDGPSEDLPPIYLAGSLLDDSFVLGDAELLKLLPPVLAALHDRILGNEWFSGEVPFMTLGELLLALKKSAPKIDTEDLATRVISEASKERRWARSEFFWGCTNYNQLHDRWRHLVEQVFPTDASNTEVAALRDALLN